jgi:hypothetical protein
MKNTRSSGAQIMAILKQAESGVPVTELCRECPSSEFFGLVEPLCNGGSGSVSV